MDGPSSTRARAVLRALADLAPSTEQQTPGLAVPTEWFRWLPMDSVCLFLPGPTTPENDAGFRGLTQRFLTPAEIDSRVVFIDRQFGERLAAVDQIRPAQRSLRAGWLFVAGRMKVADGRFRRVFHPLVTVPVRVERPPAIGSAQLLPAGDAEVSELVKDQGLRRELESHIELGGGALMGHTEIELPERLLARLERLHRFARSVASGAGLPAHNVLPATKGPDDLMRSDTLAIVAGVGVYAIHDVGETSRASSLRAWAEGRHEKWTAFHSLYLDPPDRPVVGLGAERAVESPFLLTPIQQHAVSSSRREPITLISGAPGTGKSHSIAAIACDALSSGERVLVAAKADATVDALLDLLERGPGPEPVVFGSNERREALANRLSAGQLHPATDNDLSLARRTFESSASRRDALRAQVVDRLGAESLLGEVDRNGMGARSIAPGLFDPNTDLALVKALLDNSEWSADGWRSLRRKRRAQKRLGAIIDARTMPTTEEVRDCLTVARAARVSAELQSQGGLELGSIWEELVAADDESRRCRGSWLAVECRSPKRLNRAALGAVAALATALRSGRSARREQLKRLDDDKLTRALPLWVGTLADVDDLLPPVPGLFDLVILDEASSIDQPLAATALLRGRRAVIAGDPRQLRQVSFVSDAQLRNVVSAHGLDDSPVLAARLDVRRNSTFDLAAGAAPVLVLSEHFRSDPHLVDFVMRRLYEGKVHVATRSPMTESKDCVEVVRVHGQRDKNGVVKAEVERVVGKLKELLRAQQTSVGVVTPFRPQADAIEEAVLDAFTADDLEALDLRVGTVHGFQGNERDIVIASLGVGPDEGAMSWRFIEDPHLFAVLMTRARRQMSILYSADPPEGGLVMAYLAQADTPPGPPKPAGATGSWVTSIADELRFANVSVVTAYPTGRHIVDIAIGDDSRNIGIECGIHPDGPEAHVDRHLALRRRGWEFLQAYPSRWAERRGELIVDLLGQLNRLTP